MCGPGPCAPTIAWAVCSVTCGPGSRFSPNPLSSFPVLALISGNFSSVDLPTYFFLAPGFSAAAAFFFFLRQCASRAPLGLRLGQSRLFFALLTACSYEFVEIALMAVFSAYSCCFGSRVERSAIGRRSMVWAERCVHAIFSVPDTHRCTLLVSSVVTR